MTGFHLFSFFRIQLRPRTKALKFRDGLGPVLVVRLGFELRFGIINKDGCGWVQLLLQLLPTPRTNYHSHYYHCYSCSIRANSLQYDKHKVWKNKDPTFPKRCSINHLPPPPTSQVRNLQKL